MHVHSYTINLFLCIYIQIQTKILAETAGGSSQLRGHSRIALRRLREASAQLHFIHSVKRRQNIISNDWGKFMHAMLFLCQQRRIQRRAGAVRSLASDASMQRQPALSFKKDKNS